MLVAFAVLFGHTPQLANDFSLFDILAPGTKNLMLKVLIAYGSKYTICTVSLNLPYSAVSFLSLTSPFFLPISESGESPGERESFFSFLLSSGTLISNKSIPVALLLAELLVGNGTLGIILSSETSIS